MSRTGGGPSTEQDLSEIELKFLQILGEDFGSGLPGVQVQPFVVEVSLFNSLIEFETVMQVLIQILYIFLNRTMKMILVPTQTLPN